MSTTERTRTPLKQSTTKDVDSDNSAISHYIKSTNEITEDANSIKLNLTGSNIISKAQKKTFKLDSIFETKPVKSFDLNNVETLNNFRQDWSKISNKLIIAQGSSGDGDGDGDGNDDKNTDITSDVKKMMNKYQTRNIDNASALLESKLSNENKKSIMEQLEEEALEVATTISSFMKQASQNWKNREKEILMFKAEQQKQLEKISIQIISVTSSIVIAFVIMNPSFIEQFLVPQFQIIFDSAAKLLEASPIAKLLDEGKMGDIASTLKELAHKNNENDLTEIVTDIFAGSYFNNAIKIYGIINDSINIGLNHSGKLGFQNLVSKSGGFIVKDMIGIISIHHADFYVLGLTKKLGDSAKFVTNMKKLVESGKIKAPLITDLLSKEYLDTLDLKTVEGQTIFDAAYAAKMIGKDGKGTLDDFLEILSEHRNTSGDQVGLSPEQNMLAFCQTHFGNLIDSKYMLNLPGAKNARDLMNNMHIGSQYKYEMPLVEDIFKKLLNAENIEGLGGYIVTFAGSVVGQGAKSLIPSVDKVYDMTINNVMGFYTDPTKLQIHEAKQKLIAEKQNLKMAVINQWYKRIRKVDGEENITDYFEEKYEELEKMTTKFFEEHKTNSIVLSIIGAAYINEIILKDYGNKIIAFVGGENPFSNIKLPTVLTKFEFMLKNVRLDRILLQKRNEYAYKLNMYVIKLVNEAYDIKKLLRGHIHKVLGFSQKKYDRLNKKMGNMSKVSKIFELAFIREYVWHNMFISLTVILTDFTVDQVQATLTTYGIERSQSFLKSVNDALNGALSPHGIITNMFKKIILPQVKDNTAEVDRLAAEAKAKDEEVKRLAADEEAKRLAGEAKAKDEEAKRLPEQALSETEKEAARLSGFDTASNAIKENTFISNEEKTTLLDEVTAKKNSGETLPDNFLNNLSNYSLNRYYDERTYTQQILGYSKYKSDTSISDDIPAGDDFPRFFGKTFHTIFGDYASKTDPRKDSQNFDSLFDSNYQSYDLSKKQGELADAVNLTRFVIEAQQRKAKYELVHLFRGTENNARWQGKTLENYVQGEIDDPNSTVIRGTVSSTNLQNDAFLMALASEHDKRTLINRLKGYDTLLPKLIQGGDLPKFLGEENKTLLDKLQGLLIGKQNKLDLSTLNAEQLQLILQLDELSEEKLMEQMDAEFDAIEDKETAKKDFRNYYRNLSKSENRPVYAILAPVIEGVISADAITDQLQNILSSIKKAGITTGAEEAGKFVLRQGIKHGVKKGAQKLLADGLSKTTMNIIVAGPLGAAIAVADASAASVELLVEQTKQKATDMQEPVKNLGDALTQISKVGTELEGINNDLKILLEDSYEGSDLANLITELNASTSTFLDSATKITTLAKDGLDEVIKSADELLATLKNVRTVTSLGTAPLTENIINGLSKMVGSDQDAQTGFAAWKKFYEDQKKSRRAAEDKSVDDRIKDDTVDYKAEIIRRIVSGNPQEAANMITPIFEFHKKIFNIIVDGAKNEKSTQDILNHLLFEYTQSVSEMNGKDPLFEKMLIGSENQSILTVIYPQMDPKKRAQLLFTDRTTQLLVENHKKWKRDRQSVSYYTDDVTDKMNIVITEKRYADEENKDIFDNYIKIIKNRLGISSSDATDTDATGSDSTDTDATGPDSTDTDATTSQGSTHISFDDIMHLFVEEAQELSTENNEKEKKFTEWLKEGNKFTADSNTFAYGGKTFTLDNRTVLTLNEHVQKWTNAPKDNPDQKALYLKKYDELFTSKITIDRKRVTFDINNSAHVVKRLGDLLKEMVPDPNDPLKSTNGIPIELSAKHYEYYRQALFTRLTTSTDTDATKFNYNGKEITGDNDIIRLLFHKENWGVIGNNDISKPYIQIGEDLNNQTGEDIWQSTNRLLGNNSKNNTNTPISADIPSTFLMNEKLWRYTHRQFDFGEETFFGIYKNISVEADDDMPLEDKKDALWQNFMNDLVSNNPELYDILIYTDGDVKFKSMYENGKWTMDEGITDSTTLREKFTQRINNYFGKKTGPPIQYNMDQWNKDQEERKKIAEARRKTVDRVLEKNERSRELDNLYKARILAAEGEAAKKEAAAGSNGEEMKRHGIEEVRRRSEMDNELRDLFSKIVSFGRENGYNVEELISDINKLILNDTDSDWEMISQKINDLYRDQRNDADKSRRMHQIGTTKPEQQEDLAYGLYDILRKFNKVNETRLDNKTAEAAAREKTGINKNDFNAYVKSLEWIEYIRKQRAEFHLYTNTICHLKDLSGTNPTELLNTLSMYNIRDDEFEMKYQQYCLGLTPKTLSAPDTDKRWNSDRDAYSGETWFPTLLGERAMRHHCTPPAKSSKSAFTTDFYDVPGNAQNVENYIQQGWDCRPLLPSIFSMYYREKGDIMTIEEWLKGLNGRIQSNTPMSTGGAKEDTTFAPKPKERKQFDLIKELGDIDMPDNVNFINNYFDEINKVRDTIQKEPENELEKVKNIYTTVVINILNNLRF